MSASTRIPRFNVKKIVKCKLALDQSVLSTLHRGGEGQDAYKMKFPALVTEVVAYQGCHRSGYFIVCQGKLFNKLNFQMAGTTYM